MTIQLIASISSGITSFILGLCVLSRPEFWTFPLFSAVTRVLQAFGLIGRAAVRNGDPVVLEWWLSILMTAVVSRDKTQALGLCLKICINIYIKYFGNLCCIILAAILKNID